MLVQHKVRPTVVLTPKLQPSQQPGPPPQFTATRVGDDAVWRDDDDATYIQADCAEGTNGSFGWAGLFDAVPPPPAGGVLQDVTAGFRYAEIDTPAARNANIILDMFNATYLAGYRLGATHTTGEWTGGTYTGGAYEANGVDWFEVDELSVAVRPSFGTTTLPPLDDLLDGTLWFTVRQYPEGANFTSLIRVSEVWLNVTYFVPDASSVGTPGGIMPGLFRALSWHGEDEVSQTSKVWQHNDDGSWTNITHNLADVVGDVDAWVVSELDGDYALYVGLHLDLDTAEVLSTFTGLAHLAGSTWTELLRLDDQQLWGFLRWGGQKYLHGALGVNATTDGSAGDQTQRYRLWHVDSLTGGDVTEVATAAHGAFPVPQITHSLRHCAIQSPFDSTEVVFGDWNTDQFGTYSEEDGFLYRGGNAEGSCIFALAYDSQGVLWSGNFESIYYFTRDGHTWTVTNAEEDEITAINTDYPEAWCSNTWQGDLYFVGVAPATIIRRIDGDPEDGLEACWEIVQSFPDEFAAGYLAMLGDFPKMVLGWGTDPFFNFGTDLPGQCLSWDGDELVDIGQGTDFGNGLYQLWVGTSVIPPLRLFQRDDANGLPSSGSGSIRMIGPGSGPQPTSMQAGRRISKNTGREYR